MNELQGKKALVTGGSSGYGYGIAEALLEAGCRVWITGRDREKLERAAAELGATPVLADVTSAADWDRVFAAMGQEVDLLINNAGGGGKIAPTAEQSDADIAATIAINLTGTILGCSRAARLMIPKKSGSIINISSVCALYAWPGWSIYTAAKAGLAKFSHGLYTELRPHGIRVTCLTPSWGATNFNRAAGLSGASESPELARQCISPGELGKLVRNLLELPAHLAVPDLTIQPLIQEITPM